jgi:murein DD-endopeptidase MepM/ murein hydrolase activator NlpD
MGMRPIRWARITNPYRAPGPYALGYHTGIDFGKMLAPFLLNIDGQKVRSSTNGQVIISGFDDDFGNWVGVYYAVDNVTLVYCHLKSRAVRMGQTVKRGQVLGLVGNTGNSTAPHLHVQANHERGFNYAANIAPGKWVRGMDWWRSRKNLDSW